MGVILVDEQDVERQARPEDGPEYAFFKGMNQRIAIDGALRCADCSALIDPKRDHTCREQLRANRRAQRRRSK